MRALGLAVAALLTCAWAASAAEEQALPPEGPPQAPVIRRIGPQLYQVGALQLDAKKRTIRCKGRVAMSEGGPLELLACLPTGKAYESIFVLPMRPMDLQVCLLLLGLTPGRNPAYKYPADTLEPERGPGDLVRIYVEWTPRPKDEGEGAAKVPAPGDVEPARDAAPAQAPPAVMRVPAEQFLYNREAGEPLKDARWAFLGSTVVNGRFGADLEGSLVTTYHDPLGILELAHPMVGENQYDNMDYSVNTKICPPVGTPVELVIELLHKDDQKPAEAAPGKGVPAGGEKQEEGARAQGQS